MPFLKGNFVKSKNILKLENISFLRLYLLWKRQFLADGGKQGETFIRKALLFSGIAQNTKKNQLDFFLVFVFKAPGKKKPLMKMRRFEISFNIFLCLDETHQSPVLMKRIFL